MLGRVLHGLATVDNNPDLLRLRPANRSKTSADASSLHLIQAFTAHSGAGPLVGIALTVLSFDPFSEVLFPELLANMSLSVAGKSYHAFPESVKLVSMSRMSVKLVSISRISFMSLVSLPPLNSGIVDLRTQDPKHFLAVFTIGQFGIRSEISLKIEKGSQENGVKLFLVLLYSRSMMCRPRAWHNPGSFPCFDSTIIRSRMMSPLVSGRNFPDLLRKSIPYSRI